MSNVGKTGQKTGQTQPKKLDLEGFKKKMQADKQKSKEAREKEYEQLTGHKPGDREVKRGSK